MSSDERELRRTLSEGAAPRLEDPRRPATRVRASRRPPRVPVSPTAPTLPPLELPREPLMPGLHTAPTGTTPADWGVPLYEETRRDPPRPPVQQNEPANTDQPEGLVGLFMELLGYAGPDTKARRQLLSLIFSLSFGFAQFVTIITLLVYSAHRDSPTQPGTTEWRACQRPLGIWNAIWLIRVALSAQLAVWNWRRARATRTAERRRNDSDTELATQRYLNGQPHYPQIGDTTTRAPRRQPSRATGLSYEGTSSANVTTSNEVPQTRLQARVSVFTTFLTLAWFLTAHVLAYTSVNTCRLSSPHLWWLTFGIMSILYVMMLEIFLLGLLVFVVGPFIYLAWNIFLLCLGRHPLQNPHYIKPDIGKLPKAIVQQIPLVLYIPPPPGETADPVTIPPTAHAYPPQTPSTSSSTASAPLPKRRFAFFRRKSAAKKKARSYQDTEKGDSGGEQIDPGGGGAHEDDEDVPWDEMWEKGEYPFVRLEGNRAVCAICLMDFEEPKRVRGPGATPQAKEGEQNMPGPSSSAAEEGPSAATQIRVEAVTEEERDALHLNDAGEGAQPLRLLSCGHAFHQTCLDPWLTDISGRCPTCQRPVEIPQPSKKAKRRQRT
ncbi:hypothetical protein C8Q79DRAFT_1001261 [Trametes meyenii]|nr:hypothetical protein C8Q79DRAFT_1001261 [Trametes meyenii]